MVDGVNNYSGLNPALLRQGGDVALEEIRSKLFSDIEDPALAQQLSKKTLETLETSGLLKLDAPKGDFDDKLTIMKLDKSLEGAGENFSIDMYAVMQLLTKTAQSMRQAAREQRQTELTQQAQTMGEAAGKIREAAEKRFLAAVVQGIGQIASGVASVTGGCFGLAGNVNLAQTKAQIGSGVGSVASGITGMIAGSLEKDAGMIDADKAELDKLAMLFEKARESANDMMQGQSEMIRDIRDKMAAILQSSIETNRGIARNI